MDGRGGRIGRVAPLVQVALALLVAGTLVVFSVLALRTGFADQPRDSVEAVAPSASGARPLLLPSPDSGAANAPSSDGAAVALAPETETDERVLGTRVRTGDDRPADRGRTDDGRERLDDFEKRVSARESDDVDADDHGDDDDGDESNRSTYGSRKHSKERRGHKDHSERSRGSKNRSGGHSERSRGNSKSGHGSRGRRN